MTRKIRLYYRAMLGIKKFSWASFFIGASAGFVVGGLVLGLLVNYLVSNAISGAPTDGMFLGSGVDQVREGISKADQEQKATSVFGKIVSIDSAHGKLVLEVSQIEGKKQFVFSYDNTTVIAYLANDASSTQTPLSSDELKVGDGLTVTTNEAIGSVENQHAVKIIRI